jgi:hypothetical protein
VASKNASVDLTPDPIVSGFDEPVVRLRGYVGEQQGGKVRLYWDISLTGYYEIGVGDVLQRVKLSNESGSLIVVKQSANIDVVESGSVPAAWLQGDITSAFLREGGGGRCEMLSPPSTHVPPLCLAMSPPSTHITYAWPPTTRTTTKL